MLCKLLPSEKGTTSKAAVTDTQSETGVMIGSAVEIAGEGVVVGGEEGPSTPEGEEERERERENEQKT